MVEAEGSAMEETKGEIQTTTQSSSSTTHDDDKSQSDEIPLDIITDILLRLPAKSIVRFRSLSKHWSAITASQYFIKSFATQAEATRPCLLLTIREGDDRVSVFSSPLDNPFGSFSCLGSHRFLIRYFGTIHRYYYMHGLIFVEGSEKLVVWNPTVKRVFTLPEPEGTKGKYYKGGILGYDSLDGKYILLRVLKHSKICIVTFGSEGQRSCRIISNGCPRHSPTVSFCRECINGVMFYGALVDIGDGFGPFGFKQRLMSFDVRSEKFNVLKFPEGNSSRVSSNMVAYEGRLALVKTKHYPSIDLWILNDGDGNEWTHERFVLPLSDELDPIGRQKLRFNGVNNAGELIFVPGMLSGTFYFLYFHPKTNSFREILVERLVDDEFRCGSGFEDNMYDTTFYSNHIESLVFL